MLEPKIRASKSIPVKIKEVAIAFMIIVLVLPPFLIGIGKETYDGDESQHISRGIKGISLIVHGDIGGEEWGYYITNEGKVVTGAPITPANVIIGFGPWLIGVKSGGWQYFFRPPDHVLISARTIVAILGAMTCVILFYLGRPLGGFRTGLFSSLFLAFNPLWLANSRQAMRDTPSAFFSTISVFLFYYGIKRKKFNAKASLLALSGVTIGLAIGSKQLAGVTFITIATYLLLMIINEYNIIRTMSFFQRLQEVHARSRTLREVFLGFFIFVTLSALFYFLSIPYMWTDPYQQILGSFLGGAFGFVALGKSSLGDSFIVPGDKLAAAAGIMNFILWPIYRPTSLRHFPTCLTWFNSWWRSLPCFSTLPVTVFFFVGLIHLALKGAKKKLSQIDTLTLMWFVIGFVMLSWWIPVFRARYVVLLIPALVLIEAIGLNYCIQGISPKIGYIFAGAALTIHAGCTLISFPEYRLFRLQSLFTKNIVYPARGLMLNIVFILSLFCITIPQILSILRCGTSSQTPKIGRK